MILEYRKLDMSSPNQIHKIDLAKEAIDNYDVLMEKNWNCPDLVIRFKDRIFRHPQGLIINYREVINYLKKLK